MTPEIQRYIDDQIRSHLHDGNFSQRVNFFDIFAYTEPIFVQSATIATTGNSDTYLMAPRNMTLSETYVSGTTGLATSDTNYITFSVTNLGTSGAGTAVMLSATAPNTTKATGGSAIVANARRQFVLSSVQNDLAVKQGDRILIRASATGTLANTVTFPVYQLIFQ